jgi:nucleotide-binding universal stress UspA family protein
MKTNKILVVADDSDSSVKAIQYGFNLARELNAKVALMYVIESSLTIGNVDAGIFPDDALSILKTKAEDFLTRMKTQYAADINTEFITTIGDIQTSIILKAKEWSADLIVTGTHNRTGLSRLFSGSIAESIIHRSPVPVFVVPLDK